MAAARPFIAARTAGRASGRRPAGDQRNHPHAAIWRPLARLPARLWPLYDDLQPVQSVEPSGHLAGDVQGRHRQHRCNRHRLDRQLARESAPFGRRRKRGAFDEAIGRSRGGRTTAIHALTDTLGRPRILLIAPGNVHDVMMAPALLSAAGPLKRLIADKAYDTNRLRALLADAG